MAKGKKWFSNGEIDAARRQGIPTELKVRPRGLAAVLPREICSLCSLCTAAVAPAPARLHVCVHHWWCRVSPW